MSFVALVSSGRRRMPQALLRVVLCAILAVALNACGRAPKVVVIYAEAPWREFLVGGRGASERLRDTIRRLGWRLEMVSPEGDYGGAGADWGELEEPLRGGDVGMAVLSPFMKPIAAELARRNPELPVLYLGRMDAAMQAVPSNMYHVSFDRAPAFREAGSEIGRRLSGGSAGVTPDAAGGGPAAGTVEKAAVIASAEASEDEMRAFREGFLESADEYLLLTRRLDDAGDAIKVRALLADVKERGARYYLFMLHGLLPTCMDFLHREGGLAVLEGWRRSGAYAQNVFMTVEEDYVRTIATVIGALGSDGERRVAGTVRLVRNAAAVEGETDRETP
jgi:hypothetical protein